MIWWKQNSSQLTKRLFSSFSFFVCFDVISQKQFISLLHVFYFPSITFALVRIFTYTCTNTMQFVTCVSSFIRLTFLSFFCTSVSHTTTLFHVEKSMKSSKPRSTKSFSLTFTTTDRTKQNVRTSGHNLSHQSLLQIQTLRQWKHRLDR